MTEMYALVADITTVEADAVVNAANSGLMGGGGVDGAIHMAGGPEILAECREIIERRGRLPTGQAVITTGGQLPARHVIHTVGPVWTGDSPELHDAQLASCYRESLAVGAEHELRSIAFPAISTGLFGYPKDRAAKVAVEAVTRVVETDEGPIEEVLFVCHTEDDLAHYLDLGIRRRT